MLQKGFTILISLIVITISGNFALANCPSADLTGDCSVNYKDFALMAAQWLLTHVPCDANDMVLIPGGTFEMGDRFDEGGTHERPIHSVTVNPFYMGICEVTNQQYCDYLNSAFGSTIYVSDGVVYGSGNEQAYCDTSTISSQSQIAYSSGVFSVRNKNGRDMSNDPMVQVSWYGAAAYCNWRSSETGYETCYNLSTWDCNFANYGYRLPTEAEWEYAARGGEHDPYYRFPWGDTISHSLANYHSNWQDGHPYHPYDLATTEGYQPNWMDGTEPYTSIVCIFAANGYGLYDMAGNVWDWCNDWMDLEYYDYSPTSNPTGPMAGTERVFRGGAWIWSPSVCRVSARHYGYPVTRYKNVGFRFVRGLPSPSNPYPTDGAFSVSITADLSWKTSSYAISYDVYFGTNNPPPFIGNQTTTIYDPGEMAYSTTYYWRIDAVGDAGKTNGLVWSFTTLSSPPPPPPP